jgi:hypothetical protein
VVGQPRQIVQEVRLALRRGDHPEIVIRPAINALGLGQRSNPDQRTHPIVGAERVL